MRGRHHELRVGDRIRILTVPGQDVSGYRLHDDTRRLFERLISDRSVLLVHRVDESGLPWVRYRFRNDDGGWESHWLALDEFDEWERVALDT